MEQLLRVTGGRNMLNSCRASGQLGKSKLFRKEAGISEVFQSCHLITLITYNAPTVAGNITQVRIISTLAVAERHIPKCKNIINKPKPPPSLRAGGAGGMGMAQAPPRAAPQPAPGPSGRFGMQGSTTTGMRGTSGAMQASGSATRV